MNSVVRPDLSELLALRHALPPRQRRPARDGTDGGLLARYGRGLAFAGTRPWQRGDDRRTFDWRRFARHGHPYTQDFRPEHDRQVLIAVDAGTAMDFGTRRALKSATGRRLAALLAWQAVRDGERLGGGWWTARDHRLLRPHPRQDGAFALLGLLAGPPARGAPGGLATLIAAGQPQLRPDDRVHLIGAFADAPAMLPALAPLGHRLHLWLLADPLETDPPATGVLPLAVAGVPRGIDLADPASRRALTRPFEQRRASLARLAGTVGARLSVVSNTDDLPRRLLEADT